MATDISKVSNVLSDSSKLLLPTPEEFGKLTYIGDKLYTHSSNVNPVRKWVSSKGLVYGYDRDFGNRVLHILSHTKKDTSKIKHTIFKLNKNEILKTIDEAWMMKGNPLPNDPGAYIINMGKIIGTNGETLIKIVVKPGTADILTAYPIK